MCKLPSKKAVKTSKKKTSNIKTNRNVKILKVNQREYKE